MNDKPRYVGEAGDRNSGYRTDVLRCAHCGTEGDAPYLHVEHASAALVDDRSGVAVLLWCEHCRGRTTFIVGNHKGVAFTVNRAATFAEIDDHIRRLTDTTTGEVG